MKILFLVSVFCFASASQAAPTAEKCVARNLKEEIQSIWFVTHAQSQVHFSDSMGGAPTKAYVVPGDLLLVNQETNDGVCASYAKKGKVTAFGWLKKSAIEKFDLVDFGSFDVDESQKNLDAANTALKALAEKLPTIKNWQGHWQDIQANAVKIWKKGSHFKLNLMGIHGAIGTGHEDEDSQSMIVTGDLAQVKEDPTANDVCDIVMVGFNNALLATSGAHCLGSGANHEYPQFAGIYWKQ
jgi:hypothetical protein